MRRRNGMKKGTRLRRRGEYGQDAGGGCHLKGCQYLHSYPWRLRVCRGIRCGAQVPRNTAVSSGADLDQPDSFLSWPSMSSTSAVLLTRVFNSRDFVMPADDGSIRSGTHRGMDRADRPRRRTLQLRARRAVLHDVPASTSLLLQMMRRLSGSIWCLAPADGGDVRARRDGHSRLGTFPPPVTFPRRMWAGARHFLPIAVASRVVRRLVIADVRLKQGRSGPLCFVSVRHEYLAEGQTKISERQELVFRPSVAG